METLNNGETGLSIRNKINGNFIELLNRSGLIAGSFATALPSGTIVTDKIYSYAGIDNTVIGGITWRNGDSALYNGSVWTRIPFQSLANYYSKSDFSYTSGKNMFDKSTVTAGFYIDGGSGDIVANAISSISDYIPVLPNTYYTYSGFGTIHYVNGIAFYNGTTLISGLYPSGPFLTPANCTNIRFTVKTSYESDNTNINTVQLELGSTATTYEAFFKMYTAIGGMKAYAINPDDYVFAVGKNKYDKSYIDGQYINSANGVVTSDSGFATSNVIPVSADTYYCCSGFGAVHYAIGVAFYNGTTLISGTEAVGSDTDNGSFLTPANCTHIQITVKTWGGDTCDVNKIMIEEGLVKTSYEAYYKFISTIRGLKPVPTITQSKVSTYNKKLLLFGDSIVATDSDISTKWVPIAAPIMGVTYKNYARNGASFIDWATSDLRQMLSHQIADAIAASENPDIILVDLGVNDYVHTLGDYNTAMSKSTIGALDKTIVIEAARYAFWEIALQWPNARCFYANPLQRYIVGDEANDNGGVMRSAIERMARRYGFTLIDQYGKSGVVMDFEVETGTGRYLTDGLHTTIPGANLVARFISHEIIKEYF